MRAVLEFLLGVAIGVAMLLIAYQLIYYAYPAM